MVDVISEAERMGGICVAAHTDRIKTGFEMLAPGYPNWKRDVIKSAALYGLEFDDPTHLVWYSSEDEPTSNGVERKRLLAARAQMAATAARLRLAAIQNSDAHSLASLRAQSASRPLTRFKMNELTFEGFRNAVIDPEARVRAVATIPPGVARVLGMQLSGGFLDGCTFHFSNNLDCLIGGRGTGKSTAIRSIAYALAIRDDFGQQDNCPDNIVLYCEDANGVRFRYDRFRDVDPVVQAKEDQSIKDVPADAFRVKFYGQGDLAEVAKDPLRDPAILQEFLDRHIAQEDLHSREKALTEELSQNSAVLIPLEAAAAQLSGKQKILEDVNKKLQIAETGKVKEIALLETTLAAEKTLSKSLLEIRDFYQNGMSLANFLRDYDQLATTSGALTGDPNCARLFGKAKKTIEDANAFLNQQESAINKRLKELADELTRTVNELRTEHKRLDQGIADKKAELQKKGLSGSISELNTLIKQRSNLSQEINRINAQQAQLRDSKKKRKGLLTELQTTRDEMIRRRKNQLSAINKNLRKTIQDFSVNLYYDDSGILDEFVELVLRVMHGSHFQEEQARQFCWRISPSALAELVRKGDLAAIAGIANLGESWANQIIERFVVLTELHALEITPKPPRPVIKVLTKEPAPKIIPVNQLSDGQKHTILLTIAMLAESNLPLVIDQPEDDLDNAFIFNSVVSTLRAIKERRQVIVVTHNANIAVLGDSELLFPMKRSGNGGTVSDRGSIDKTATRKAAQDILEGGELAFKKRKEIYGY